MVKIQRKSNGQYVVTLDKQLAEAMSLEGGEEADWEVASRNSLKLSITERDPDDE